jgi:hypothetical protein
MFAGNEKEHVFSLLPGEERLDELTIHHQHLFFVKSGVTRVTLTTNRVLYTTSRVFSPVYWLLLVLITPLIFYYAFRIGRNRNVAMPLGSIDSVEKRYRANWPLLILLLIASALLMGICVFALSGIWGRDEPPFVAVFAVRSVLGGLMGPVILFLLLATRLVGFEVRTRGNNLVFIAFSPGDSGGSEETLDAFFRKVHSQIECAKTSRSQSNSVSA